jgi:hypothetical protein
MTDRFYTRDYRPEVYTKEGFDWVENTTMVDVIRRHNPQLALSLTGVENAFKPWGLNMTADYESWSASAKADHLWVNGAKRTQYKTTMPALKPTDTAGLISTILWKKVQDRKDVADDGYVKPIHQHASMAKVKFVPLANNGYTGIFQGSDYGLLRLSVTEDPAKSAFTPGLAWKAFVNGKPSENVSALYTPDPAKATTTTSLPTNCQSYVSPSTDSLGQRHPVRPGEHQAHIGRHERHGRSHPGRRHSGSPQGTNTDLFRATCRGKNPVCHHPRMTSAMIWPRWVPAPACTTCTPPPWRSRHPSSRPLPRNTRMRRRTSARKIGGTGADLSADSVCLWRQWCVLQAPTYRRQVRPHQE